MARFPKIEQEKRCALERRARQEARNSYYLNLKRIKDENTQSADKDGPDPGV